MKETEEVESTLNESKQKGSPILSGSFVSDVGVVKYSISPKISVGDLLQGDVLESVKNTAIRLEFGRTFDQDEVQINVMINGKLAACLESPQNTDTVKAVLTATKLF